MSLTLTLRLCPPGVPLKGEPLKTVEGLTAALVARPGALRVDVATTAATTAEARWLVRQLVDALRAAFPVGALGLRCARGASRALARALTLDLASLHGALRPPPERPAPALPDDLAALAALEASYRAWVDEDAATRTSLKIAEDVLAYAAATEGVEAQVLDADALAALGMNLLLAVGGASEASPPRLIVATYGDPSPDAPPLMLVGKGITFDSGGVNVKPYEGFVSMMRNDMGGAALAWHLFRGLVAADFPAPLVVVLPACENLIDARAVRPGSVIKSHRGLTVRVDHTDAEGRLILADALSWASAKYGPSEVVTFATLTTAALNAYGPFATPVHFAPPALERALARAAEEEGEDLHFFPYRAWHHEANRDHTAQLKNTARLNGNASAGAGSRNAAHFLRFFTDSPLTHLDIFASTWDWSGQAPAGTRHGATGAPLRTLLRALMAYELGR
ncbi:MAG: hypothetical protein FJ138_16720 [Deltaproteobacteria bacterium]|nr:hypothetical protein [Deltaproteobacteria bacterium]